MDLGLFLKLSLFILLIEKGEDDEEKLDSFMGFYRNNVFSFKYIFKIFIVGVYGKKIGYVYFYMFRYCTLSFEIFYMIVVLFYVDDKRKKEILFNVCFNM